MTGLLIVPSCGSCYFVQTYIFEIYEIQEMDFNSETGNTSYFRRYGYCRDLRDMAMRYRGSLYSWKKNYEHKGEAGLKVTYDTKSKE
jgi:hypothetical protein